MPHLIGSAVFAISGVLAVTRRGLDVVGAVMLGLVTAIGGGTLRDLAVGIRPFWITDVTSTRRQSCSDAVFAILRTAVPDFPYAGIVGMALIFAVRGLAIHRHLQMPLWLTARDAA